MHLTRKGKEWAPICPNFAFTFSASTSNIFCLAIKSVHLVILPLHCTFFIFKQGDIQLWIPKYFSTNSKIIWPWHNPTGGTSKGAEAGKRFILVVLFVPCNVFAYKNTVCYLLSDPFVKYLQDSPTVKTFWYQSSELHALWQSSRFGVSHRGFDHFTRVKCFVHPSGCFPQ